MKTLRYYDYILGTVLCLALLMPTACGTNNGAGTSPNPEETPTPGDPAPGEQRQPEDNRTPIPLTEAMIDNLKLPDNAKNEIPADTYATEQQNLQNLKAVLRKIKAGELGVDATVEIKKESDTYKLPVLAASVTYSPDKALIEALLNGGTDVQAVENYLAGQENASTGDRLPALGGVLLTLSPMMSKEDKKALFLRLLDDPNFDIDFTGDNRNTLLHLYHDDPDLLDKLLKRSDIGKILYEPNSDDNDLPQEYPWGTALRANNIAGAVAMIKAMKAEQAKASVTFYGRAYASPLVCANNYWIPKNSHWGKHLCKDDNGDVDATKNEEARKAIRQAFLDIGIRADELVAAD